MIAAAWCWYWRNWIVMQLLSAVVEGVVANAALVERVIGVVLNLTVWLLIVSPAAAGGMINKAYQTFRIEVIRDTLPAMVASAD